jgi:hypothetical protein
VGEGEFTAICDKNHLTYPRVTVIGYSSGMVTKLGHEAERRLRFSAGST